MIHFKYVFISAGAVTLAQFNAVMGSIAIVGTIILTAVKIYKELKK